VLTITLVKQPFSGTTG